MKHRELRGWSGHLLVLAALVMVGCDGERADPADAAPDAGCAEGFFAEVGGCVDVDECRATPAPCDPRTECINLSGSFTCTACPRGFIGDGLAGCVCPRGQHPDGAGGCAPRGECAAGRVLDETGACRPCEGAECAPLACPDDDGAEPDDTPETAGPIDGLDRVACADDPDHFRLAPGEACRATVTARPAAGIDLRVVDATGATLGRGEASGGALVAAVELAGTAPFAAVVTGDGVAYRLTAVYDGHDGGDGDCVDVGTCSAGYRLDGEDCVSDGCPAGEHDGGEGECVPVGTCSAGFHDGGDGDCVPVGMCQAGFRDGGDGDCVPVGACSAGFHDGGDGDCVPVGACSAGFHDGGDGDCVPIGMCRAGFHDGGDGDCVPVGLCSAGFRDGGDGACLAEGACGDGFHDGGAGACLPVGSCEDGFHDGGDGGCLPVGLCAAGYGLDRRDGCRRRAVCPEGSRDDGAGDCVSAEAGCAFGYHPGGGGNCVPVGDCDPGFVDRGDGRCGPARQCIAGLAPNGDGRCVTLFECGVDDPHEPSDAARPARVAAGETLYGVLCGDVDLYRLVGPPCAGRVVLRHDSGEGDLALTVWSEVAPRPMRVAETPTDDERIALSGPGPWRIQVHGESARYALRVDLDGHDGGDGSCQPLGACAEGYTLDDDGACTLCAAGFQPGGGGRCAPIGRCAPGYHDGNGSAAGTPCVPEGRCVRGFRDGGRGVCLPEPVCAPGFADRGDGVCAPDDAPCLGDRVRGAAGCECPAGSDEGGDGACVPAGQCSPGHQLDGAGVCTPLLACAPDHHFTPWGECRMTEVACGGGERDGGDGRCSLVCAPGFRNDGGLCVAAPACAPDRIDDGAGRCVEPGQCAAGRRPIDGACLPVAECPGAGTEVLDEAPALILGGRGEDVVCAPAAAVWRIERPAGCGAVARLVFDASRIDLDLELLAADGAVLRATASTGAEERLVLEADDLARYLRVRAFPADAVGEAVYRVELWRDPQRCPGACAPPLRPDGAGDCVARGAPCAAGYRDGGNGACVPLDRCALGFHDDGFGRCVAFDVCAPGALFGPDGRCRPAVDCGPLDRDDGTGQCVLLGGCAEGYRDGGGGACVAPPACASGYVDDGQRACVRQGFGLCAAGFEPNGDGFCLAGACPEAPDGDDTLQSARPVDVDGVVRVDGAICGDDVDYYRVELFAGCALEAHLRFDHGEGDLALGFIGPGGGLLGPIVDTGTDDEIGGHHAAVDGPVFVAVEPVGLRSARYRLDLRVACPE